MVLVLSCTGLRVSDAVGLGFEDVTLDGLGGSVLEVLQSRLAPYTTALADLERHLKKRYCGPPKR